jgi:hypothetical protein
MADDPLLDTKPQDPLPSDRPAPQQTGDVPLVDLALAAGKGFAQGAAESAGDIAKGTVTGLRKGKDVLTNLAARGVNAVSPGSASIQSDEDRAASTPEALKPSEGSVLGPLTESLTAFGTTYALTGGFFGRWRQAQQFAESAGGIVGRGAAANAAMVEEYDKNFSAMLTEMGGPFDNWATRLLATGKDDGVLQRKAKAALEGVVMDGVFMAFGKAAQALRKARAAGDEEALAKAVGDLESADRQIQSSFLEKPQAPEAPKASTMPQDASVPSGPSETATNAQTAVMPSNGVVGEGSGTGTVGASTPAQGVSLGVVEAPPTPAEAVSTLVKEGIIPSDAVTNVVLDHTNWNRINLPDGPKQLLQVLNASADQAASVSVKGTKSFDEMLDRAVELTGDPSLGKDVKERLAGVMSDIAPSILSERALTAALAIKTTNAALKGDKESFRALTASVQEANVFRMALQREAARATASGRVEILSERFPQVRQIWASVISPEEIDSVAKSIPSAPEEKALAAAAEAGQQVHPTVQRSREIVSRLETELTKAQAAGDTTRAGIIVDMLGDARTGLQALEASETVLGEQMQIVKAASKAGLDERGVSSALQSFYDTVNKYGVRPAVELWQSSILSGFKTVSINIASNAFNTLFLRPGSRALGAAASLDAAGTTQALRQWNNLFSASVDALKWNSLAMRNVFKGFREERPIIGGVEQLDIEHAIPGMAGRLARSPAAVQNAADEFFKNINYQATVRTMAYDAARLSGEDPNVVLRRYLETAFESSGQAARNPETGEAVFQEALREAFGATFTDELLDGTVAKSVQTFAQQHPLAKFFIPFVRTPANLISKGLDYTPGVNYLRPTKGGEMFRKNLSHPDPMIRNQARGELAASALIGSIAAYAYANGSLTGSGPAEPKTRKAWLDAGNKPYTLKIGNDLVDITRIDPIAMPFMVMADLFEAYDNARDESTREALGVKLLMTVRSNLTNRTFMKGLENAVNLSSSNPNDFGLAARSYASTVIPKAVSQFANYDAVDREAKTLVEAVQRQTPGWRQGLPPMRDPFGEIVAPRRGIAPMNLVMGPNMASDVLSPFSYSTKIPSDLKEHFIKMGVSFTSPDRRLPSGLDLTQFIDSSGQSAYDYWRENVGLVVLPLGGKKLDVLEALEYITKTPDYQKIKAPLKPGDSYNKRVQLLQAVYESYKMAALENTAAHFKNQNGVDLLKDDALIKAGRSGIDVSPWFDQLDTNEEKLNALLKSAR